MVLDSLGALGEGGEPSGSELVAALCRRTSGSFGVSGGQGATRDPLVLGTGLGRFILGLDELAREVVDQDEASGQAGIEDHDEQDVEIGVITLDAGHLAAHGGVRHDPHAHAWAEAGAQATDVAPVVQLKQQAAQEGSQPLALAAVHSCQGVTRRLQDAAYLSPWVRGSKQATAVAHRSLADHAMAGRRPPPQPPYPRTLAPPSLSHHAPSRPKPPLPRLRLSRCSRERGPLMEGGEGAGTQNARGLRQQRLARQLAEAKLGPWAAK